MYTSKSTSPNKRRDVRSGRHQPRFGQQADKAGEQDRATEQQMGRQQADSNDTSDAQIVPRRRFNTRRRDSIDDEPTERGESRISKNESGKEQSKDSKPGRKEISKKRQLSLDEDKLSRSQASDEQLSQGNNDEISNKRQSVASTAHLKKTMDKGSKRKNLNLDSDMKEQIIDNPREYIMAIQQRSMAKSIKRKVKRLPKREKYSDNQNQFDNNIEESENTYRKLTSAPNNIVSLDTARTGMSQIPDENSELKGPPKSNIHAQQVHHQIENPFNHNKSKGNSIQTEDSVHRTGTPKLPNQVPLSPRKKFQETDPDEVNPSIDHRRGSKKVAFASSSKIIESGSGSHRRSSNKSYNSEMQDEFSQKTIDQEDTRIINETKLKTNSLKIRYNPYGNKSQAIEPVQSSFDDEYTYNKLTPKDRKHSDANQNKNRTESFNALMGKRTPGQNQNTKSETQSNISRPDNNEKGNGQNENASTIALKNKSQPFYLRGYLKDNNLNMNSIMEGNNVSISQAEKFFDDEDEQYNVKMIIKDFMVPQKKSVNAYNFKLFGMKPEEYEKDKIIKLNKKKRKSQFGGILESQKSQIKEGQTGNSSDDKMNSISDIEEMHKGDMRKSGMSRQNSTIPKSQFADKTSQQKKMEENKNKPFYIQTFANKKKEMMEYLEESTEYGISQMFIISRSNRVYKCWQAIITILCLISSYIYANIAAFRMLKERDDSVIVDIYATFESFFFIDMILQFFVEQQPQGQTRPVTKLDQIAWIYLKGDFLIDFIAILPLQIITMKRNRHYLFLVFKCIRLIKGLRMMETRTIMKHVKHIYQTRLQQMIDNEDPRAHSQFDDQTKIEQILIIRYAISTFRLIVLILNTSYFLGIFWYILCNIQDDMILDVSFYHDSEAIEENPEFFQTYFSLNNYDSSEITIIVTYFAFTSLSTVGFGDYHPRSDFERLCCSFILLFGVAIFSIIMGNFSEILISFKEFNAGLDDGDRLTKFFGTIQKFNNMESIDIPLKCRIEEFFDYKWEHDKNQGFQEKEDIEMFNQLTPEVQVEIYNQYLFKKFLIAFAKVFSFQKIENPNRYAFFTWDDQNYRSFMIDILQNLECRREDKYIVLYNELDEMNEVLFFEIGMFEVGYEINRFTRYVLRFKNSAARANVIGAYGATFNKRSLFKYRTVSECKGFFIRKLNWLRIIDDNTEIAGDLRNQVRTDFEKNVQVKVMREKNKDLKKWAERADYECILAINANKNNWNKDPHNSQSNHNQSVDFYRSPHSQAQSISVENVNLELHNQSNTLQQFNSPSNVIPASNSNYERQSVWKRDSISEDLNGQKEQENEFCRNIERNKFKLEYLANKQNVILDLYDKLYQKFIQVKRENHGLMLENQRLKRNDMQTREGYISSPQCDLKPINELDTEYNDIIKYNRDDIQLGEGMEMMNYDIDKYRVKNHSLNLYQSEQQQKKNGPQRNIQNRMFGLNSAPNDKESSFSNPLYNQNQVPTIPSFVPDDQINDFENDKYVSNFSNASSQAKDMRPNFFFKQQRRLLKAREIRDNNFAQLNQERNNNTNSVKTPIFNVYYSQNSDQQKDRKSQNQDWKNFASATMQIHSPKNSKE